MTVKLSERTVGHFARARLWRVLVEELPEREPGLAELEACRLEQLCRHLAEVCIAHGFDEPNAAFYFALTMVRVHPLFHEHPAIAAELGRLRDARVPARERPAILTDAVLPAAWTEAARHHATAGAGYWAQIFRQADEHGHATL